MWFISRRRFCVTDHIFRGLQRRSAPENLMWNHQTRKTFDGPPSPVPQRECVALLSSSTPSGSVRSWSHIFCGESAYIGLFELPRASVSGHHRRTGAELDVTTTLAGSSDENLRPTTGMCTRPLTALGYVSLGKKTPLHFHKSFTFFWGKRHLNLVSQFPYFGYDIEILKSKNNFEIPMDTFFDRYLFSWKTCRHLLLTTPL
jgi:hypothetical protein